MKEQEENKRYYIMIGDFYLKEMKTDSEEPDTNFISQLYLSKYNDYAYEYKKETAIKICEILEKLGFVCMIEGVKDESSND